MMEKIPILGVRNPVLLFQGFAFAFTVAVSKRRLIDPIIVSTITGKRSKIFLAHSRVSFTYIYKVSVKFQKLKEAIDSEKQSLFQVIC